MSGNIRSGEHRRHVTIVFCDVCNSSRLALELEPEDYSALLAGLRNHAERIVADFGGTIIRIDGDGFIILFGYPDAYSNASERAIEATLTLHEAAVQISQEASLPNGQLQLHSGIHGGVTLIRDGGMTVGRYEILGNPTNVTARLCDYAKADEIVVSEIALGKAREKYVCSDRRDIKLRGQKEKIAVRTVLARNTIKTASDPSPTFKGRDDELRWILDFLHDQPTPAGPAILIGESGMGKSRLIREAVTVARTQRPFTFVADCEAFLDARPLSPIRKLLSQFLVAANAGQPPDVSALPSVLQRLFSNDPEQISKNELSDLADAMIGIFESRSPETGITLIIDDWHWVDELTEATINLLIRRKQNLSLRIVISSRHDPDPLFGGDQKQILRLSPLDADSIRDLIFELVELPDPSLAARITTLSEGNPLYISEFCHAANEGGQALDTATNTSWLHALTNARFQKLPVAQAKIVKSAAVIGFDVSYELLREVSGIELNQEILNALQSADFLFASEDSDSLKFKHGLTRNAVYSLIGLRERRALHRKVINIQERLLSPGQREEAHSQLAYHYSGANLPEKALENAIVAGDKALQSAALDRAQQLYAFALDEYKKLEDPEFGIEQILYKYGLASIVDPGKDQSIRIDAVRDWSARHDQPVAAAWAHYWLAFVYYGIGRPKDALREFLVARDAGHRGADQRLVSRVTGTLGQVYAATSDYQLAIPALEHSIEMQMKRYQKSKNPAAPAYSIACLGFVLADQGEFGAANQKFIEALELIAGQHHQSELSVRAYHGVALMWQGELESALETWQWIVEHASRMRSRYHIAKSRALLGITEFLIAQSADSLEPVRKIADSTQLASQQRMSLVHGYLSESYAQVGDWEKSKKYAVRTLRRSQLGDRLGDAQAFRSLTKLAIRGRVRKSANHYMKSATDAAEARVSKRERSLNEQAFRDL